jgi:Cys-tRNA(Pro) deacylase
MPTTTKCAFRLREYDRRVEWPEPVERVAAALREAGTDARLEEFREGTATAADAARALGCEQGQIVKSLVLVCDGAPLLALVPGDRRADTAKVARAAGAAAARAASPEEVTTWTGFPPGGIAPFALAMPLRVLVDRDLLGQELVWIGAGSPRHVAGLSPHDLVRLCRGEAAELAE